MKKKLELMNGTPRSVFSKTWIEPELKDLIQELAQGRGMKESQFIRWLILTGVNSLPDISVTEVYPKKSDRKN